MGEPITLGESLQRFKKDLDEKNYLTVADVEKEFSYLELTENDKIQGLLYSYRLAADRLERNRKERLKEQQRAEALRPWTYEEMKFRATERGKAIGEQEGFSFRIDDDNAHALHLLSLYFTGDPAFEEESYGDIPYSLDKGIWLQSPTRGTGKTILLRCFQVNKRLCFFYQHMEEMRQLIHRGHIHDFYKRCSAVPTSTTYANFLQEESGFMYDEFFGEDKVFHGGAIQPSEQVIKTIYDIRKTERCFWKYHITSNFDGAAIEEKVGATCRSRMVEMFNLIKLEGGDRRKQKQ